MSNPAAAALRLHRADNVVVTLHDLKPGSPVTEDIICSQAVPMGHKVAAVAIQAREPVIKYGQTIGVATQPVKPGEHVHTHNLTISGNLEQDRHDDEWDPGIVQTTERRDTFEGFVRADGRVGTRNYIGVLATVNCSASVSRWIADAFGPEELAPYPYVDGVVALHHAGGCGMAGSGEGFELLQRVLAGYMTHPNFFAVVLVGLGCEVMQVGSVLERMLPGGRDSSFAVTIQAAGGVRATVDRTCARIRDILPSANRVRRQSVPAGRLHLGLQCGGSDAWSGITANPALGMAVDLLVGQGGTAILGETPEIYGAQHLLTRRAEDLRVARQLDDCIRWWEAYTAAWGGSMDNNPSPGNKAGGLTTIWEKSLGAVSKGGRSPLMAVYRYAEKVAQKGLVFMDTPGYDPVSVTGMVAGGATVVAFTTGCGSVFGAKPAPVIKLATNTPMYGRMSPDMDINCGLILDGQATVEQMGRRIFKAILETASGKKSKSEQAGMGDCEFVPWQIGAVM